MFGMVLILTWVQILNSIRSLLKRLHYYQDGNCIVHDMFGHEVVERIKELYCDAFLTAHFEVPGEMFSLAMEAKRRGMGVVGSTQNILDFIKNQVQKALDRDIDDHLQFVLGTESGMLTSIVAAVRGLLGSRESRCKTISSLIGFSIKDINEWVSSLYSWRLYFLSIYEGNKKVMQSIISSIDEYQQVLTRLCNPSTIHCLVQVCSICLTRLCQFDSNYLYTWVICCWVMMVHLFHTLFIAYIGYCSFKNEIMALIIRQS
ncbi:unnamed protein product [Musa acuminata subsp. malaccensis]|uniref:quinolinate synthase n=1 Tax=Musa acuminata subsp. malaccensis TaxID=214687 RepID=A0A804KC07_MUSAM|nr:unnamed protein product [Musa acuminata subsp. malaccensis]